MKNLTAVVALLLVVAGTGSLGAQTGYDLFQKALATERAAGNLREAIALYERVVKQSGSDRALAARALVRMAECYQKLGDLESQAIYERIVRQYADQPEAVTTARSRLASTSASLEPAFTRRRVWSGTDLDRIAGTIRVSPDGRYLVFAPGGHDLVVRDLTTRRERVLVHDEAGWIGEAAFSPDGRRIVFNYVRDDRQLLQIINADGTSLRTIMAPRADIPWLWVQSWTPDGTRILIETAATEEARTFRLAWIDVADGRVTVLVEGDYAGALHAAISANGREVAFGGVRGAREREIHIVGADGTGRRVLSANASDLYPVGWTQDGLSILTVSQRGARAGLWALPAVGATGRDDARVVERDLCSCGEILNVAGAGNNVRDQTWIRPAGMTRRGDFYFRTQLLASDVYVAALDARTGKAAAPAVALTLSRSGYNMRPQWSPDGTRLLLLWNSSSLRELSVADFVTGAEDRLTGLVADGGGHCWAGNDAIIVRRPSTERGEFRRVTLSSREEALLFPNERIESGERYCSADGRIVAYFYLSGDTGYVKVRNLDTGSATDVELRPPGVFGNGAALSPDGTRLVFLANSAGSRIPDTLFVKAVAGGDARPVARAVPPARMLNATMMTWSPDGRHVYYVKSDNATSDTEVFRVPAAGGPEERVGLRGTDIRNLHVSPDGTRIAFAMGALNRPEVWAIENPASALAEKR